MILYFIVISSLDISWTVVRTMSTSISLIFVLMLLVVNVTGKKYIVETEDELDFSPEMDESISRGNISRGYTLKFLEMSSEI